MILKTLSSDKKAVKLAQNDPLTPLFISPSSSQMSLPTLSTRSTPIQKLDLQMLPTEHPIKQFIGFLLIITISAHCDTQVTKFSLPQANTTTLSEVVSPPTSVVYHLLVPCISRFFPYKQNWPTPVWDIRWRSIPLKMKPIYESETSSRLLNTWIVPNSTREFDSTAELEPLISNLILNPYPPFTNLCTHHLSHFLPITVIPPQPGI